MALAAAERRAPLCRCTPPGTAVVRPVTSGPNENRLYYSCARPHGGEGCSYFAWVDAAHVPLAHAAGPPCKVHHVASLQRVSGPSSARPHHVYYTCASTEAACNFFEWAPCEHDHSGGARREAGGARPCTQCGAPVAPRVASAAAKHPGATYYKCDCGKWDWPEAPAAAAAVPAAAWSGSRVFGVADTEVRKLQW